VTRKARVGWVVDAQVDFLDPQGRLYVKDLGDDSDVGSVQIVSLLERAVRWMSQECDIVVFTGDWHGLEDDEIDPVSPDPAAGTYPPHCMGRSLDPEEREGAAITPSIRPPHPIVLPHDAGDAEARIVARTAVAEEAPVFIHKTSFDVFEGNTGTEAFLRALSEALGAPLEFIVVGVARDVCVTQAVDGMQARDYPVTALSDVTWGLGLESEDATLERWAERGTVTTLDELVG
jgi:nicotinamidase/pyrazinamidase